MKLVNVLSIKFNQTRTHPRRRSSFVRVVQKKTPAKDAIIFEVDWAHWCIRMTSAGITAFVKKENMLELIDHQICWKHFFLLTMKSHFMSRCCSSEVNSCIAQLWIGEVRVLLEVLSWSSSFNYCWCILQSFTCPFILCIYGVSLETLESKNFL